MARQFSQLGPPQGTCGKAQWRPIIRLKIKLGMLVREIDVSLSNREHMDYRLLLGRNAMEHMLVDHLGNLILGNWSTHDRRALSVGA